MIKIKKSSSESNKRGQNSSDAEIRRLGVIIERIDDKVELVAEQYGDIKKTLDSHTEMISNIATDLSDVKETLESHTKTLESHTKTLESHTKILESHTEMISNIATDLEIVKEDVEFTKNSLKRKIDVEEFAALEKRVSTLERRR